MKDIKERMMKGRSEEKNNEVCPIDTKKTSKKNIDIRKKTK